jgi:glycosyltransferase involved in cell wall biosynthesis
MTQPVVSVILPFYNQAEVLREIVQGHLAMLTDAGFAHEIILVPNGSTDSTTAACRALAAELLAVRCVEGRGGWGQAVRTGIAAASGAIICYTNSARTQASDLQRILIYAAENPGLVVKAVRLNRHARLRRLGSLVYNALCRNLLSLATRDVNGTPKAFPRSASPLLHLQRDDDLIDLEFMWRCATSGLNVVEIPVYADERRGGRSTTGYRTAWRLLTGAIKFWQQVRIDSRDRYAR